MNPARTLEQLLEAYQQADLEAAAELVAAASPPLFRYLVAQTRNPQEAEDVLQETWLRVHRSRHSFRPGSRALPWLFAIAEHARLDACRKSSRRRRLEVAGATPVEPPPPVAAPASARIDIGRLVEQLPAGQKEVVILLKFSGMTLEEVARIQGSSIGAIKLKAHRAYESLRCLIAGRQTAT